MLWCFLANGGEFIGVKDGLPYIDKLNGHNKISPETRQATEQWLAESADEAPRRAALVEYLLGEESSLKLADARKANGAGAVKWLLEHGWAKKESIAVERDPLEGRTFPPASTVTLTHRQEAIASQMRAAINDNSHQKKTFLGPFVCIRSSDTGIVQTACDMSW